MNHFQRLTNLRLDRKASKERTREHAREHFESIHALHAVVDVGPRLGGHHAALVSPIQVTPKTG
jgi:hypothetical protein